MKYRIGHGYDLHRLEPKDGSRPFMLGGIELESDVAPVGHSDADALLHALTDALLGAIGEPDLGTLFPNSDPRWAGAESSVFLAAAAERIRERGWTVANVDATVVLERPKLIPHRARISESIASLIAIDPGDVNVKGKTHEGVDAVGEGHAIEVHAVALLVSES